MELSSAGGTHAPKQKWQSLMAALLTTLTVASTACTASDSETDAEVDEDALSQPFGGTPRPVPGTIQAEDFDAGGEGNAYHDTTVANIGGIYRTNERVDLHGPLDGSPVVGATQTGEWLKYTVNVTAAGSYNLELRVSSIDTGGKLHVEVDGSNVTGSIVMPTKAFPLVWTTITRPVTLTAGQHVLRVVFDQNGTGNAEVANLNWLRFTAAGTPPPPGSESKPFGGTARSIPGRIEAEDYDTGGQGVAYNDTTTANLGGIYRNERVDLHGPLDGSPVVGATAPGEWLKYTVNVTAAGSYDLGLRVSSIDTGGKLHVEVDGSNVTGSIVMPTKKNPLVWTTITRPVTLTAGQHVLRVVFDQNGTDNFEVANLNWLNFSGTGIVPPPVTDDGDSAKVFNSGEVNTFEINISGADWNAIVNDPNGKTWRSGSVRWSKTGKTYPGVGIRGSNPNYPGNAKPSLRLAFDEFADQRFQGLNEIKLDALRGAVTTLPDVSKMRERISYGVYRNFLGNIAPRETHCVLKVNGVHKGLYAVEERVNKDFIKSRFPGATVNQLYEFELFNDAGTAYWFANNATAPDFNWLGTNPASYVPRPFDPQFGKNDTSGNEVVSLLNTINNSTANAANVFDIDKFLRLMAIDTVVGEGDSYAHIFLWKNKGFSNNFYLYKQPNGKFMLIPWDKDHSYWYEAPGPTKSIFFHFDQRVLTTKFILNNPTYQNTYKSYIRQLLNGYHSTSAMLGRIDTIKNQIQPHVQADPSINFASWQNGVNQLKSVLQQRNNYLNGQVP